MLQAFLKYRKFILVKSVGFGFILFFACQTIARGPQYVDDIRILDTVEINRYRESLALFFDSLLNQQGFSGGILVAKNGTVLYEHYQGDVYGTSSTLIDSRTPFHVASTSKTFTSTAILQLASKNLLNLDDLITVHWPEFPYQSVTIRHLLNHSSGIPDYAYFLPKLGWDKKNTVTNWDVLEIINRKKPGLMFNTGTRFKYCNTNFVLLALIVEKVTGLTFPYYVKENIFDVAGMEDSYILTSFNRGDYMPSWTEKGKIYNYEYLDGLYGDKNVFTTCRDLMKYDEAIRSGKLLDLMQYQKAWEPNFKDTKYDEPWEYYGLGWRLKVFDNDLKIPYHNGWWHGNNAVFQRLVADTAVIIVTGNRMNRKIYASAKAANIFRPYYPDTIMGHQFEDTTGMGAENKTDGSPGTGGEKEMKGTTESIIPSPRNSGQNPQDKPNKPSSFP
jgi:CubicO group peptidase (beta-lactamase class C family)